MNQNSPEPPFYHFWGARSPQLFSAGAFSGAPEREGWSSTGPKSPCSLCHLAGPARNTRSGHSWLVPFPLRHCGHLPSSQSMAPRKSQKPGWMFGILGAQPLCSPLFWLFGSMFIRSEGAKDYNYECKQNRRSESARVLAVWTGCFCGSFYGELSMNPVPKHFWTGSLKGGSMHSDSERNNVVLPTRQQLENSAISGPSSPPLCSPGPNECRSRMFRLFPCPLHLLLIFTQECLHSPKAT